ncbi:MAG: hypothetical protein KGO51_01970 [Alphaproteobacteria bacterium]|nr:hypothetical protein [Alphaproteobacteria bacterium]
MRKLLAAGLAALTFGGAVAAAAIPATAEAREWHDGHGYRGDWDRHHDNGGAAIVAGIAGLAIGAALADSSHPRYDRGYAYRPTYYGYDDDDDGYRVCETRHWAWDPYIHRRVLVTSHYAC